MTDFRPGRFEAMPTVVKNIIIINVIMVLLQFVLIKQGINLQDILGLHYWASPLFRWWQPLTHMFMHGDPNDINATFWHIALNMFALWMFGRILENIWGPKRFLTFYIICGLGAALCHTAVLTYEYTPFQHVLAAYKQNPGINDFFQIATHYRPLLSADCINQFYANWVHNPDDPQNIKTSVDILSSYLNEATVGASGAVFGVLFAFGYLFPNTELMLLFPPIPIKAKWLVGGYALIELYSGIRNSAGDNVAHFAHLGGMLFAFILLRIWNNKLRNRFY